MNKYYGKVGYCFTQENAPGVWEDHIEERFYYGDILRNARRWDKGVGLNDDLNINNQLSILADPYAYSNFQNIKYASYMGTLWKVTNIEVQSPRLVLTLGGEYNGEQA